MKETGKRVISLILTLTLMFSLVAVPVQAAQADPASAAQELRMHGVRAIDEEDPLTAQALKFYCRGFFNFQGDGERYMKAFEHLADSMALSGDYNTEISNEQ